MFLCILYLFTNLKLFDIVCRKIWMCWIQISSPNDQTMAYLKTNLYLLALTNCTKWILRSLILGKTVLQFSSCICEVLCGAYISHMCLEFPQVQYSKACTQQCTLAP